MPYKDLREWITKVEEIGELRRIGGVPLDPDVGAITDIAEHNMNGPAVLFDNIPGFSSGYQILVNPLSSLNRVALTAGLPLGLSKREYIDTWHRKLTNLSLIKPTLVSHGPLMENVFTDGEVDMTKFPTPWWHELDGGRYIGTADAIITRDPEEGWVNMGTYRVMVIDKNHLGFYISPGKHGRIHREKYFAQGRPCPVAMCFGHDPLLFLVSCVSVPRGITEYDYAGGLKGEPIEVMNGPVTGLPIPAWAEIVIEGESVSTNTHSEGPFGEWPGYYASGAREEPVVEVKALYHRNNPILLGTPPAKPPTGKNLALNCIRAGRIREEMEKAGVPDVTGVWLHEPGGAWLLLAVSIKQRYPGHARQAGHVAALCGSAAYMGRYVFVVDDDIDVTDLSEVMWAVATRSDPKRSIDIIERCWSSPVDPAIPPPDKLYNSRCIIDACRPYEWLDKFSPVVELSKELKDSTMAKWGKVLFP